MWYGLEPEGVLPQAQPGKKGGGECLRDTNIQLSDIPEADEPPVVARVVMACLVLHNLLRMRYAKGQQDDFGADDQPPIVLEGNDIPHEGQKPLEAAKTQRNILRDYFMTDGQVPWHTNRI